MKFRKESVTRLVQKVRQEMDAQESELALSAAVFPNRAGADVVGQDWEGWLDTGALDFTVPMAYVDEPTDLDPDQEKMQRGETAVNGVLFGDAYLAEEIEHLNGLIENSGDDAANQGRGYFHLRVGDEYISECQQSAYQSDGKGLERYADRGIEPAPEFQAPHEFPRRG